MRRLLLGVAGVAIAVFVVAPLSAGYLFTHLGRDGRAGGSRSALRGGRVRTSDGVKLAGWYVPSRNGAAVIAFPGRSGPLEHARMLARHGYGVLMLDMRGQGESEGDPNAFGWQGERPRRGDRVS